MAKTMSPLTGVILYSLFMCNIGTLNLASELLDVVVGHMRSRVFVESKRLEYVDLVCDSLGGPYCYKNGYLLNVIPSSLVVDFPVGFSEISPYVPLDIWKYDYSKLLSNERVFGSNIFQLTSSSTEINHHYSLGLPEGVIAQWDGAWTVVHSIATLKTSVTLNSPRPGYIRFSKPVLIKKLMAELSDSSALVAFRKNSKPIWSSKVLVNEIVEFDICSRGLDDHGPMESVDEIVVFSKGNNSGLKILSMEVEGGEDDDENDGLSTQVPVLLLTSPSTIKILSVDKRIIRQRMIVNASETVQKALMGKQQLIKFKKDEGRNEKFSVIEKAVAGNSKELENLGKFENFLKVFLKVLKDGNYEEKHKILTEDDFLSFFNKDVADSSSQMQESEFEKRKTQEEEDEKIASDFWNL